MYVEGDTHQPVSPTLKPHKLQMKKKHIHGRGKRVFIIAQTQMRTHSSAANATTAAETQHIVWFGWVGGGKQQMMPFTVIPPAIHRWVYPSLHAKIILLSCEVFGVVRRLERDDVRSLYRDPHYSTPNLPMHSAAMHRRM